MGERLARAVAAILLASLLAVTRPPATLAVDPGSQVGSDPWHHVAADGPVVHLWFGFSSTCPHCRDAIPFVDELDGLPWLEVRWLQVDGPDAEAAVLALDELGRMAGGRFEAVPTFLFGGRMLVGWADAETTGARLASGLAEYHHRLLQGTPEASPGAAAGPERADTVVTLPLAGDVDAAAVSLPLLAVVLGGLDAFNPCALAVLLFLMGSWPARATGGGWPSSGACSWPSPASSTSPSWRPG